MSQSLFSDPPADSRDPVNPPPGGVRRVEDAVRKVIWDDERQRLSPGELAALTMKYDRGELEFTDEEAVHLASWENQVTIIRVRVGQCVTGKITGFYLWGEGGRSKSYTVLRILDELQAEYRHHQGRLSAVGLAQELEQYSTACHVIEDLERLLREKDGPNLLRAALWSQSKAIPMVRPIEWKVNKKNIAFDFTGSIIITSNQSIGQGSVLAALQQRLRPYHLAATRDELKAVMKAIALKGYEVGPFQMTPAECMSVYTALIEGNHPLDIRTLINGFTEFITEREGESLGVSWRDLLASMVHGKSSALRKPTREEVMQKERGIATYIDGLGDLQTQRLGQFNIGQRLAVWKKETGKGMRAYYDRLKEVTEGKPFVQVKEGPPGVVEMKQWLAERLVEELMDDVLADDDDDEDTGE